MRTELRNPLSFISVFLGLRITSEMDSVYFSYVVQALNPQPFNVLRSILVAEIRHLLHTMILCQVLYVGHNIREACLPIP